MPNDILIELSCPSCSTSIKLQDQRQQIACPACSSELLLEGHICLNCAYYHQDKTSFCHNCGHAMNSLVKRLDEHLREAQLFKDEKRADYEQRMTQWQQDRHLLGTAVFVLSIFIIIVTTFAVL